MTSHELGSAPDAPTSAVVRERRGWDLHPGVRSGDRLTAGERATCLARDGLGSWIVVAAGAVLIAAGVALTLHRDRGADLPAVFALAGVGLLELSVVLMTLRASDRAASEAAVYDVESVRRAAVAIEELRTDLEQLRVEQVRLGVRLRARPEPPGAEGDVRR